LSFFDEDDEPRRSPRPRRATAGGPAAADTQTLLVRRLVGIVGVVVVVLLLLFLVRGCMDSRKKSALRDYNRTVTAIGSESSQTGAGFFQLMGSGQNESPQDLQTQISSLKVQADQQLTQAQRLSAPDEMRGAQQSLLIALEWRRDGLEFVAERIRTALGDSGDAADTAIEEIAGQNEVFLASDVDWRTRVVPFVTTALRAESIADETTVSQFVPDIDWLRPEIVAEQLGQQLSPGAGRNAGEPTGPGLHGTNIDSVAYGDVTLQPGTPNTLVYDPKTTFAVKFTNGGENDEFDIKVTLKIIPGGGGDPITLTDSIDAIAPKASAVANLALDNPPPIGTAVTIRVQVAPVPGEEKTDNNRAEYQAIFERG
jgi:hypothetical protein